MIPRDMTLVWAVSGLTVFGLAQGYLVYTLISGGIGWIKRGSGEDLVYAFAAALVLAFNWLTVYWNLVR
jgi:hypothetical protein